MRRVDALNKIPENNDRFRGANPHKIPYGSVLFTFFYPDYTVGSGVTPDHARFPNKESDVPKQARGLYHRSGIAPCPEGY